MNNLNPVKKALSDREVSFGSWIQTDSPEAAEIIANSDFQWIAVDCEHGSMDIKGASEIFRAISAKGKIPFARVSENAPLAVRRLLDNGAQGIIIPLVNNALEAENAVSFCKYPPEGVRGFAFCRANDYGVNFNQYVKGANSNIPVVAMIESAEAIENIEEILSVEGIDGVFIGPYDLSGSFGVPGQLNHPNVKNGIAKVIKACAAKGKSAGIHLVKPDKESLKEHLDMGFTFIALGMDTVFLSEAVSGISKIISEVPE